MQFVYGNFSFDVNSVSIAGFTSSFVRSPTGRTHLLRKSMAIKGRIVRGSMSQIESQMAAIQTALSLNGQTAVMLDNNNSPTPFVLDSPSSIGGVMVTQGATNDDVSGSKMVTFLEYTAAFEAEYLWAGLQDVLEFSETLSFSDNNGLPLQVERIPVQGPPIIQNITEQSFYHCTQSGQMRQAGPNPQPPAPAFPGLFRGYDGSRKVTQLPTQAIRGTPISYGCAWNYEFINIEPFGSATPNYR